MSVATSKEHNKIPAMASLLFLSFLLLLSPSLAFAWGQEGHYITCMLAESLFTQSTLKAINTLLPNYAHGSLASMCSWPDEVRRSKNYHWSSDLHFIDTPDFQCTYNYDRDCHSKYGEKNMCCSGAIKNFTSQLETYRSPNSKYNLTEALLFLGHIVGDIHQPLHVGYTGDEGGNTIIVHWYGRKANLHHVWDSGIIDTAKERFYDSNIQSLVDDLKENITDNWDKASTWSTCHGSDISCPDVYARESIKAACRWAYKGVTPYSTLDDDYFLSRLPIVQERLLQGGVRLAAILNGIFARNKSE